MHKCHEWHLRPNGHFILPVALLSPRGEERVAVRRRQSRGCHWILIYYR
jgi:hypothetical protein